MFLSSSYLAEWNLHRLWHNLMLFFYLLFLNWRTFLNEDNFENNSFSDSLGWIGFYFVACIYQKTKQNKTIKAMGLFFNKQIMYLAVFFLHTQALSVLSFSVLFKGRLLIHQAKSSNFAQQTHHITSEHMLYSFLCLDYIMFMWKVSHQLTC